MRVDADQPDGTAIYVYDDDRKTELGTAAISGRIALVTVAALTYGQRIIAYAGAVGHNTGGSVAVVEDPQRPSRTGWKIPTGEAYETYLTNGGNPLAPIYTPEDCFNRVADYEADLATLGPENRLLSAAVMVMARTIDGTPQATATVVGVDNAEAGYEISFDGGAYGDNPSRTYYANGSHSVTIRSVDDAENFKTIHFDVTLPDGAANPDSEIGLVWFDPQKDTVDGDVLALHAICERQVEFSVDGVTSFSNIPAEEHNGSWVDGGSGKYRFWSRIVVVPQATNYTARVRVKDNPADEKAFDVFFV